jgi:hypothetical protein
MNSDVCDASRCLHNHKYFKLESDVRRYNYCSEVEFRSSEAFHPQIQPEGRTKVQQLLICLARLQDLIGELGHVQVIESH